MSKWKAPMGRRCWRYEDAVAEATAWAESLEAAAEAALETSPTTSGVVIVTALKAVAVEEAAAAKLRRIDRWVGSLPTRPYRPEANKIAEASFESLTRPTLGQLVLAALELAA